MFVIYILSASKKSKRTKLFCKKMQVFIFQQQTIIVIFSVRNNIALKNGNH